MDNIKDEIWLFFMRIFSNTCHQKAERSFFLWNYQLPICARCTGLLLGYIVGLLLLIILGEISIILSLFFIIIMFFDWFIQYKNIINSNNLRRLITGSLCGIGIVGIIGILEHILCYIF